MNAAIKAAAVATLLGAGLPIAATGASLGPFGADGDLFAAPDAAGMQSAAPEAGTADTAPIFGGPVLRDDPLADILPPNQWARPADAKPNVLIRRR